MSDVSAIAEQLAKLNATCGAEFAGASKPLQTSIGVADYLHWAETCLSMATSGWHGWETTRRFIALTPALVRAGLVRDCGDYALGLAGFSIEPAASYLRGVDGLLSIEVDVLASDAVEDVASRLGLIEQTGQRVTGQFPHAVKLVGDYFSVAFDRAAASGGQELIDWLAVMDSMVNQPRSDVLIFLQASAPQDDPLQPKVPWHFVRQLQQQHTALALAYLLVLPKLAETLDGAQQLQVGHQLLRLARDPGLSSRSSAAPQPARFDRSLFSRPKEPELPLAVWLDSLAGQLVLLTAQERACLLMLFDRLEHVDAVSALLGVMNQLPLDNPHAMSAWLGEGLDMSRRSRDAGIAFFGLESSTSVQALERLQGQVLLADCQRQLQFYTEALVGSRLRLVASEDIEHEAGQRGDDASAGGLAGSDGARVVLPAVADLFATRDENFRFYKAALLHQLGFYEYGTFDFKLDSAHAGSELPFRTWFRTFGNPALAGLLFRLLEDARIDWQLVASYRGIRRDLDWLKADAIARRSNTTLNTPVCHWLEALVLIGLDGGDALDPIDTTLVPLIAPLRAAGASLETTRQCLAQVYEVLVNAFPRAGQAGFALLPPAQVVYRGIIEPDRVMVSLALDLLGDQTLEFAEEQEESLGLSVMMNPADDEIDEVQEGKLESPGMLLKEGQERMPVEPSMITDSSVDDEDYERWRDDHSAPVESRHFKYDEWDCGIDDYRRDWCTLMEVRRFDEDPEFVDNALAELAGLSAQVRRQLNMLRPSMLAKVRGMEDGEELDMQQTIDAIVDKRAGRTPTDRIYIQKQRKQRDVSALFLLDMSASTDDPMPVAASDADIQAAPVTAPAPADIDYLRGYDPTPAEDYVPAGPKGKRIIDLEKEAVVLMAEALKDLGDNYAICGFSGYGRENVEYYVCKDFTEPYNQHAKNRIGGIKPCRSTRMGPAIRHASKQLQATESRIKALIILSDGYPQDYDYGPDRNSRTYGVKDTTKALSEARQQGISTFCLTVDPSGHDYLREMCPNQQYMVIQDIQGLPGELSKVYRGLTA